MRVLVHRYQQQGLSRRGFLKGMAALGFSAAAAEAVLKPVEASELAGASPADPDISRVEGTGGDLMVAQAKAAGVEYLFTNPGSFEAWNALGIVFARQRDAEGAITAWERAHEISPEVIGVLYHLALAHAQAGHLSQAIGYFEQFAARAEPGPQRQQALTMAQRLRTRVSQSR